MAKAKKSNPMAPIISMVNHADAQAVCWALPGLHAPRFCPTSVAAAPASPKPGMSTIISKRMPTP